MKGEEAENWLEASCRAITSPSIVSHHYQLCSVVYISSLHALTYVRIACLPSSAAKSEFKGLSPCQNDQSPFFPTAQMIDRILT